MRASYDTDAMRGCAQAIESTASSLEPLSRNLDGVPVGAVPDRVDDALGELARQGKTMIAKITDEAAALSSGLRQAAQAYDDVDSSLCRAFTPGPSR